MRRYQLQHQGRYPRAATRLMVISFQQGYVYFKSAICRQSRHSTSPAQLTWLGTDRGGDKSRRSGLRSSQLRRTSRVQAGTVVGRVRWLRRPRGEPALQFGCERLSREKVIHPTTWAPRSFDIVFTVSDKSQHISLGWMETRTALAHLIWNFDLELADSDLDWQRDSRMYTLWSKPHLLVKARPVKR